MRNKSFLYFVNFKNLFNWSVKHLSDKSISYNDTYIFAPLREVLRRNKTAVEILDNETYKRVTIKINNGGVFLRDKAIGQEIGTKNQFKIKAKQFILSKIDARNGAFGIATEEVDEAIITGNFWAYDVDYEKIDPVYLSLITTTKQFTEFCQKSSAGTTNRHYLKEELFLDEKIPLPDLPTQQALVAAYQSKMQTALALETQAKNIEHKIERYLFEQLGIEIQQAQKAESGKLRFVRFKELSRWDILFNSSNEPIISAHCPMLRINEIIYPLNYEVNGKSLRFESFKQPNHNFLYLGMEHVEKNSGQILEFQTVKGVEIKSQTLKVPKGYFIYGKLRPYLNKFWFNNTDFENVICSSEFLSFALKESIDKDYFLSVIGQSFVQKQIQDKVSGARMPRLSPDDFNNILLPVPSDLDEQKRIATNIQTQKQTQKSNLEQAATLKVQALVEFEQAIFV